ncbi:MAG: MFS transporter [Anaerolineales bacterium]|nr:MFS transporter [Anaerolineales bacterium]
MLDRVRASITNSINEVRGYNRSVKLFLAVPVLFGMYYAIKGLFFNFYILAMGMDKAFLGVANGMTPMATLILAFPLGVLTDRMGRKRSVFLGMIILAFSYLAFLASETEIQILITLFITGVGETMYFIAATPLLTRLTTQQNRVAVFSLRSALFSVAGVVGSFIGGQMPLWFESLFGIQPETFASYRGILFTVFFLLLLTLIPVSMIPKGDGEARKTGQVSATKGQIWKGLSSLLKKKVVWQLFLPNLAIGLGAALMVPYLNLFLRETFNATDQLLGVLFSVSSLITGFGTLLSPWLARRLGGRIHALVFSQATSLGFLLVMGFSPWLGLAVLGFWGRNAFMNMAQPLYNAFSMEQVSESQQGTLNSILSLSWNTGWALMPAVSGFIQAQYGFSPIFITTGILYAISTLMIWAFFKNVPEPVTAEALTA